MSAKATYEQKQFGTLKDKTLRNALAHRIGKEFPRIGGHRILTLCADMILDVLRKHLRPREYIHHGQVLWLGFSIDDPPSRGKRTRDTDLIPIILDLSTVEDVQALLDKVSHADRILQKASRLCTQAYQQGALLSNSDLAELMNVPNTHISRLIKKYEDETGKLIPRRANVHDMGSGVTHKRIICWKRFAEGKEPTQIAKETYHSLDAVDNYLGQYDRVRHCLLNGMSVDEIAYTLRVSKTLVQQYVEINEMLTPKND